VTELYKIVNAINTGIKAHPTTYVSNVYRQLLQA